MILVFRLHYCRQRPYHVENTGSRLITAVKKRRAWLVLGWVTAWEHHVLLALFFFFFLFQLHLFPSFLSYFEICTMGCNILLPNNF